MPEAMHSSVYSKPAVFRSSSGSPEATRCGALLLSLLFSFAPCRAAASAPAAALPPNARAVWDVDLAYSESSPTRERICINGLWQWQPAGPAAKRVPEADWGWFKVPGAWPGITDYMQKDCQQVVVHPTWQDTRMGAVNAAWYRREITVPRDWAGRRITLRTEYLNSFAAVFVDGSHVGDIHFPGGDLDLTAACRPGDVHSLCLLVVAMPLQGVVLSYTDSASAREIDGRVARRGLCGDVYLDSSPAGPRVGDVRVVPSVRGQAITIDASIDNLSEDKLVTLQARITRPSGAVRKFASHPFGAEDLRLGRLAFSHSYQTDQRWDLHTPHHQEVLQLTLADADGKLLDVARPQSFGFREFWIEGRDFYLNGTRIFLSALPLDNAQVSAGLATYQAARESLERLQSFGINFVYTHNYGCEPGSHLGFEEILRAADDVGMLVAFSLPHFSHYSWSAGDADVTNGYARHAEFYVRAAQNHPSVVAYAMSHNATGYNDDMNPDRIDGLQASRDSWATRNVQRAQRAEVIARRLDPDRVIYHHASGNLGPLHASNFYPNFAPIQELSDWFEHWATEGVKPVFTCEYGAPFSWDWTLYRGWYDGKREFGSAVVPWEFCLAEWNAQFLGARAYRISEPEKANLRWEARQLREGKHWHRWDYPFPVGSRAFDERYPVFAAYLTDNWRAFRTWGVSAVSPWEHAHFWKLRPGVTASRQDLPVDWDRLQRPGFSPDYIDQRYERMDLAYDRTDWVATPAAQALLRNNRPHLGYLAGKASAFTSRDHNLLPGERFEKQVVVINNAREPVHADIHWRLDLPQEQSGTKAILVEPGQQHRLPLAFDLPATLPSGSYVLIADIAFDTGETQRDHVPIHVLSAAPATSIAPPITLYDPPGRTRALLDALGIDYQELGPNTQAPPDGLLIVGQSALTVDGPAPDIAGVRNGLKVLIFEQSAEVLERRFGFRTAEYGLRQVFPRVPDHPALKGLNADHLRDWRGESTLVSPRAHRTPDPGYNGAPTTTWCGLTVPRLWRCGTRGTVASVLIEKPTRGDFLPVLDGGFSLQYCPLLEYREGRGLAVFCQLDVTGRTEPDPAARILVSHLVSYLATWKSSPPRPAAYLGEPAGREHLESIGITLQPLEAAASPSDQILVVGHGVHRLPDETQESIARRLAAGGRLLAVGLHQEDADAVLASQVEIKNAEHIAAFFEPQGLGSPLAGVCPADVHNRDPRTLPLVAAGATVIGNGVLALDTESNVVFCQLAPWQFEDPDQPAFRRTHRRSSFLLSRILSNLGVQSSTPLLDRFERPVRSGEQRWLSGFYLDQPRAWDDPYRFFRW